MNDVRVDLKKEFVWGKVHNKSKFDKWCGAGLIEN